MEKTIPLRWISNSAEAAGEFLDHTASGWRFAGYRIEGDFPLSPKTLAPYVVGIFDKLAPLEAYEIPVGLISIKNGVVRVF